ncbi:hypothetical protein [Stenotrophomonas sp. 22385]|uniref:hypothetical protein n=1 Tax=Stenotrophomonas sp. 22385 TaxID=3453915 RepID=UPI003F84E1B4
MAALLLCVSSTEARVAASIKQRCAPPSDSVVVTVRYVNTGAQTATIREADIPRAMPDGKLWSDYFQVVSTSGNAARYTGNVVNLVPEVRNEAVALKPGEEVAVDVNISANYALDQEATYDIQLRGFQQSSEHGTRTFTDSPSTRILPPRIWARRRCSQ